MTQKKFNLIKFLSLFIVICVLFTVPGFATVISAANRAINSNVGNNVVETDDVTDIDEYSPVGDTGNGVIQPDVPSLATVREKIKNGEYQITGTNDLSDNTDSKEPVQERSGVEYTDMSKYLKKYNIYSQMNTEGDVNLNDGSVNLSYVLANMAGANGMDLNLSVKYSSTDSNTLAPKWFTPSYPDGLVYFLSTYSEWGYYDNYGGRIVLESHLDYQTFSSDAERVLAIQQLPPYQEIIFDYYGYDGFYVDDCMDRTWEQLIPYLEFGIKDKSAAKNYLGQGWSFNIPCIEIQHSINVLNGEVDTSHKVLMLDDGRSFNMTGYTLDDHAVNDITISAVNLTVNNKAITHTVTLKDGTVYYFDEEGCCIRKENRFGEGINYQYTVIDGIDPLEEIPELVHYGYHIRLNKISDDFGREINIAYSGTEYNVITVTSSDGSSVTLNTSTSGNTPGTMPWDDTDGRRKLLSIDYGSNEIYSFTYGDYSNESACEIDPGDHGGYTLDFIPLTRVTYPNSDYTEYTYTVTETPWGDGTMERPMVTARKDVIGGAVKNSATYTRTGSSYTARANVDNGSVNYTYTVNVSSSRRDEQYVFNMDDLCISASYGNMITTKEYNNLKLPSTVTTKDYGSGGNTYVQSVESYTYDSKGNVLTYTDPANVVTTYTYDNTYSLPLTEQKSTFSVENTLSSDSKTILSAVTKENNAVKARTDYTYDSRGNILTKTEYIYPSNATAVTTYSYTDNVTRPTGINLNGLFCTSVSVGGIKNADGITQSNYTETYKYDLAGRKTSVTDARGYTTLSTYDTRGRLLTVTYPNNSSETYSYNITANTVTHTDRAGYTTLSTYDTLGNLLTVKEVSSNTILQRNTYDAVGRLSSTDNRNSSSYSAKLVYTYDNRDRITAVQTLDGNDIEVAKETYAYTVSGSLLKTTKTVLGDANSPSMITTSYVNNLGRTVKTGRMLGSTELSTTYTYDVFGNVLTETLPGNITTTYTYDYAGRVLTATDALNNTTTNTYTSTGLLLTSTDARGNTVTYTYDKLGRVLTKTAPIDAAYSQLTKTYYDADGNVTETKVTVNAPGQSAAYSRVVNTYDNMNRLTQSKNYDGNTIALSTSYTYDNHDNVLTQATGTSTVTNVYNARGKLVSTTDALNNTESYTYDANGYLITKTDRNGTLFTYTYNALGKVLTETAARTGQATQTNTYTYTKTGLVRSENNGSVSITRTYDSLGRVITETEYDGTDTATNEYVYDSLDRKIEHKLTLNNDVQLWEYYSYDKLGRLLSVGKRDLLGYTPCVTDSSGNIAYETTVTENVEYTGQQDGVYIYNTQAGTWTKVTLGGYILDEAVCGCITINNGSYSGFVGYDPNGNGSSFEEYYTVTNVPANFAYENSDDCYGTYVSDFGGSIKTVFFYAFEENNDWVFRLYVYNGNYFNVTMPQGTPVYGNSVYVTYTYDENGNVLTATYDNGTSTEYTYNKANLPTSVTNKQGTATVSSYAYTYYLSGNVRTVTENTGKVTTYTYDKLGRLTKEETLDNNVSGVIQYTYDNRSNRATMTKNGYTTTYTYDLNNRLTAESKSGEVKVYSYDANGNQLQTLVNNNFAGIYAYDLFNRQVSFSSNNIGFTYYTYRPDGLRHSAGTTKHFWSEANIVLEKTGNTITEYHRGLTLIYYKQGNTVRYYLYNGHGDVVKLTTDTGVVVKTYVYDAFGEEQDIIDTDSNHFRYCGEYYDKETKTLYLRARYYNSSTGRFTQQDDWEYIEVGNPLTSNLYTYCWNNPVNGKDPSGHVFVISVIAVGIALMAGVALTLTGCTGNKTKPNQELAKNESILNKSRQELMSIDSSSYNCYGNAIGKKTVANPSGYKPGDTAEKTYEGVVQDVGKENIRKLNSIDDYIGDDEYRVALRCGPDDYHFIRQLDDGTWYSKSGKKAGTIVSENYIKNGIGKYGYWYAYDPDIGYLRNPLYFGETIYFAIKKDWSIK